jgi:hypothetical protein
LSVRISLQSKYIPIIFLLAANIICGLIVFRDYGLSWDEPLFYDYAQALGYAYSPREWFSGDFNLDKAYGASASDHANRGPAYILLVRQPEKLLESLGLDRASAWHLINFLTFQLGVYFIYRLCLRWMRPWSAFGAAALFSTQPLLWGHAFINPKDPPFLVFITGSLWLGFEMVDRLAKGSAINKNQILYVILSAFFLGIATSIRVLGPLAGLFVFVYALMHPDIKLVKLLPAFSLYSIIAILTMFITWPFLWPNPLARFIDVTRFMSANPTQLAVLFNGEIFRADELPRRYLPALLGLTLTESVWPLFFLGLMIRLLSQFITASKQIVDYKLRKTELVLMLAWFLFPFVYVIMRHPPMYDGIRHFLFILPPVFIMAGMAFDKVLDLIQTPLIPAFLIIALLLPGIRAIIQLHPYEYTYYNVFIGGTGGAFRKFETDYWLTCYKEALEKYQKINNGRSDIFVKREPYIAAYYADSNTTIRDYRAEFGKIKSGDLILVNTRSNEDLKTFRDAPVMLTIGRAGADFCYIKKVP